MGNFWGLWLIAWWGALEVLSLLEKEGSEHECSPSPQGWDIGNKDLLLPALIVGFYTRATCGWALVCSVTINYVSSIIPDSNNLYLSLVFSLSDGLEFYQFY